MTNEEAVARRPQVFDQAFLTGVEGVTELLLIRHAQQEVDRDAPIGELVDPPLSELGQQQARLLAAALSTQRVTAVYSSALRRAFQTAEPLARALGREVRVVDDLREVEVFREIPRDKTPREFLGQHVLKAVRQRMLKELVWDVYPHSESSFAFRKRTSAAVEAILQAHAGERVAVISHGGVINVYLGHIIGVPQDMFFRPLHASISVVTARDDRRVLHSLNDVHHLVTAEGDFRTQ